MNPASNTDKKAILQLAIDVLELNLSVSEAGETTLAALGIDSLQIIQLSMELEDSFGLQINMENIQADMSLSALLDAAIQAAS